MAKKARSKKSGGNRDWSKWGEYVDVEEINLRGEEAKARLGITKPTPKAKGKNIASSFWGRSWCRNLQSYADYDHRLSRGRSYLRHGAVIDLAVEKGLIRGKVAGSMIYDVSIRITAIPADDWLEMKNNLRSDLTSVVDILAGKIPDALAAQLCSAETGIFPAPQDLRPSCNCLDFADLCKHASALLYAFGVHLDDHAEALFTLRGIDPLDLLATTSTDHGSPDLLALFDLSLP